MSNELVRPHDRTALLVLRAWIEHGSSLPLRAYLRETSDVSLGFEHTMTVTDVDAAVDAVRTWLEALVADEEDETRNEPGMLENGRTSE